MIDVKINGEFVELYKVLKFEGLAQSGGQAKSVIANGEVTVNGEIETRKRKKLVAGDIIKFDQQELRIEV
ncbi:MAG: ribosome-associated protein [Halioglobus sp.]|jgi:ribosome-associated protein